MPIALHRSLSWLKKRFAVLDHLSLDYYSRWGRESQWKMKLLVVAKKSFKTLYFCRTKLHFFPAFFLHQFFIKSMMKLLFIIGSSSLETLVPRKGFFLTFDSKRKGRLSSSFVIRWCIFCRKPLSLLQTFPFYLSLMLLLLRRALLDYKHRKAFLGSHDF